MPSYILSNEAHFEEKRSRVIKTNATLAFILTYKLQTQLFT